MRCGLCRPEHVAVHDSTGRCRCDCIQSQSGVTAITACMLQSDQANVAEWQARCASSFELDVSVLFMLMRVLHRLLELLVHRGKGELGCETVFGSRGGGQVPGNFHGGLLCGSWLLPEQAPAHSKQSHLAYISAALESGKFVFFQITHTVGITRHYGF